MKNSSRGSIVVIGLLLAAFVLLVVIYYYFFTPKAKTLPPEVVAPIAESLPDEEFIKASDDAEGRVLARGDINGDGFEDAVVQEMHCGASCGVNLAVIFNDGKGGTRPLGSEYSTFAPAFYGSSAVKSDVKEVSIKDGIISLTGNGLDCTSQDFTVICTEEKWNVEKTVTYKFDGTRIVQLEVKTGEFGY